MALVQEQNETFKTKDWNAYLINNRSSAIEIVLIVSKGNLKTKTTSTLRHKLDVLPAKSYAKVEWLQDDVLSLDNSFQVTFFEGHNMFEKTFLFPANSEKTETLITIPLIEKRGILLK